MSWGQFHSQSELFASEAELASRVGDLQRALELYRQAASAESTAFKAIEGDKQRTLGITAVSAVALWYKARDFAGAEQTAHSCLASGLLPQFAKTQLRDLLQAVWTADAADKAGVRFVAGDVLVSVKGGQVIHGGAPLDLILRKVEGIQSVLLRTVEMLLERPFRKRGAPPTDIQSMFRPWLIQAPAGSYQFAVRMQEPEQGSLFDADRPKLEVVTETFFRILRAASTAPDEELPSVVPNREYREAFLNLSRGLAPRGKSFDLLELRDASMPTQEAVRFALGARQEMSAALRRSKPARSIDDPEPTTVIGILRALDLDKGWLEVVTDEAKHIHVENAGDALDDVVGPMVNRRVEATVIVRGGKYLYQSIEAEE